MPIWPLSCVVQKYAWGSATSIPERTKQANPDQSPWAELWMGAHPKASSTLSDGQSLADLIASDPETILGRRWQESDGQLPFLFKILAAAQPLSIQCHPNLDQARAGFAAENAAGLALDAGNRNYRDANHKPELLVALEEFWALKGFREEKEIARLMRLAKLQSLEALLGSLQDDGGLATFFRELLTLSARRKQEALGELAKGLAHLPEAEARWTREFLARYPDDIFATAALVLELVQLQSGEALYLGAGELHAYLQGTGLEIMANSDNVLRGGLTPKHIDIAELMKVLHFTHKPLQITRAVPAQAGASSPLLTYPTPCQEFELSRVQLDASAAYQHKLQAASIFLCLAGAAELSVGGSVLSLPEGSVAFASADTGNISMRGSADLWIASIPG